MTSGLDAVSQAIVHRVWADRLGVAPVVFEGAEPVFVHRSDLQAAVVVRLGETIAVAAPERALTPLRRLAGPTLLNVTSLLGALEHLRPKLLGVASLSFADHQTIAPVPAGVARAATDADVDAVISRCSADERDESGLLHMATRWIASDDHDGPGVWRATRSGAQGWRTSVWRSPLSPGNGVWVRAPPLRQQCALSAPDWCRSGVAGSTTPPRHVWASASDSPGSASRSRPTSHPSIMRSGTRPGDDGGKA